ncbi:MAG: GTPase ObgE [Chloroflexia bacterium]|nr:GTPase ObgE [Chloroflexia bacterium]
MLYDQAKIYVKAGDGGHGCVAFRREKYVPFGGPAGGNGGRGGHVYLQVSRHLNTLIPFKQQQHFRAENGRPGEGRNCHGANGADVEILVPPGTVVHGVGPESGLSVDLLFPDQRLLVARGGKGGRGNAAFATPTHQTPRMAELGEPGEERWLQLELKLIADVGLVGYPNAGKSTLLATVSAARPKIAAYPFTTLSPNLGVVTVGDLSFVMADIPGLIEGASEGTGLGLQFLRHIERTRLIIHVLDGAGIDGRDPLADYAATNHELAQYSPILAQRRQIVAWNKMDLPDAQAYWELLQEEGSLNLDDLWPISAATGEGVQALINRAAALLQEMPPAQEPPAQEEPLVFAPPTPEEDGFRLERDEDGFAVHGRRIERLARITNFALPEAADRFQRALAALGIEQALVEAGVGQGDRVRVGPVELFWEEEDWNETAEEPPEEIDWYWPEEDVES